MVLSLAKVCMFVRGIAVLFEHQYYTVCTVVLFMLKQDHTSCFNKEGSALSNHNVVPTAR